MKLDKSTQEKIDKYISENIYEILEEIEKYNEQQTKQEIEDLNICGMSDTQMWLIEQHGVAVMIITDIGLQWIYKIQSLHSQATYRGNTIISKNSYQTYKEALAEGLKYIIKKLKLFKYETI